MQKSDLRPFIMVNNSSLPGPLTLTSLQLPWILETPKELATVLNLYNTLVRRTTLLMYPPCCLPSSKSFLS